MSYNKHFNCGKTRVHNSRASGPLREVTKLDPKPKNRQPHAMHHKPHTLHPVPYTLQPRPVVH